MANKIIEQIKAFKTSDGTVFESRAAANEKQALINLNETLEKLIDAPCDLREEIVEKIVEQREQILAALKDYVEATSQL